jgi:hypothetical protein
MLPKVSREKFKLAWAIACDSAKSKSGYILLHLLLVSRGRKKMNLARQLKGCDLILICCGLADNCWAVAQVQDPDANPSPEEAGRTLPCLCAAGLYLLRFPKRTPSNSSSSLIFFEKWNTFF